MHRYSYPTNNVVPLVVPTNRNLSYMRTESIKDDPDDQVIKTCNMTGWNDMDDQLLLTYLSI